MRRYAEVQRKGGLYGFIVDHSNCSWSAGTGRIGNHYLSQEAEIRLETAASFIAHDLKQSMRQTIYSGDFVRI